MNDAGLIMIGAIAPRLNDRWAAIEGSRVRSDDLPSVRAGHLAEAYVDVFPRLTPDELHRIGQAIEGVLQSADRDEVEVFVDGFIEDLQNLILLPRTLIAEEDVIKTLGPLGRTAWTSVGRVWRGELSDAVMTVMDARRKQ